MRMKSRILSICACGVLLLGGCSFHRLKQDLAKIDRLKPISGDILNETEACKPVVVVLWAIDNPEQSGYWVVEHEGAFRFWRNSGRYYLVAYEDYNADAIYQTHEAVGVFGGVIPQVIDLDRDDGVVGVSVEMLPPGKVTLPPEVLEQSQRARRKDALQFDRKERLTTIDDPAFSQKNATLGLWSPYKFFEEVGMHIYFLEPFNPAKIPVLLVHGADGHPGNWRDVVENMDRERFQPWLAFYPSGLRLGTLSNGLRMQIDALRHVHQFNQMYVLAHSMGGLVSRDLVLGYGDSATSNTLSIPLYVTFATPWNGHEGAEMGVKHAPAVVPSWYDMVPGSEFIDFLFERSLPEECQHHMFFSHRGKSGLRFSGDNTDGAVSLASQLYPPAQEQAVRLYGVDADHVGIISDTNTLAILNGIMAEVADSSAVSNRANEASSITPCTARAPAEETKQ